ncbi:hypothetical protein DSECCO2_150440 [anaerobic digester metagenome]
MDRNHIILTILLLFGFLISIQAVYSAEIIIGPTDSIQTAIDTANPQDTIILNNGTYNDSSIQVNKELTLKSVTENPDDVIIDAQQNGRVIEVLSGVNNVKIQGLTISNGYFDGTWNGDGAGISNKGGTITQPTQIINCKFTNNNATGEGGAIYNRGVLTITNCTLTNNTADGNGGGISNRGNLTITGSVIQQNTAPSMGGGIYNLDTMTITSCTIQQNQASGGGGILNDGDLTVTGSTIHQNQGDNGGGINNFDTLTITASVIGQNTAPYGGGIANWNTLNIVGSIIQENTAEFFGGGLHNLQGTANITDTTFQLNNAGSGGGMCNWDTLTITSSTIKQNNATSGGGIFNDHLQDVYGIVDANFNRIVANTPNAIQSDSGTVNAEYNWWGSNNPNFNALITGDVDYISWLVMTYSANSRVISLGGLSTLNADFRYDSNGVFHDPAAGHLPDETPVTFTTNLGNVGSKSIVTGTINGIATAILRGNEAAGEALTSARLDNQTLTATVTITPTARAASSSTKTIGMQSTGIPLAGIGLAILLVSAGLILPKRKQ